LMALSLTYMRPISSKVETQDGSIYDVKNLLLSELLKNSKI
jgi:hypothetical protein